MAERTVKVRLSADVNSYTRSVMRAADETDDLRRSAEAFDGRRYRATIVIDDRQIRRALDRTNRSLAQTVVRFATFTQSLKVIAAPPALLAMAPAIASIGASAVDAVGILNLLPAAGFAAAAGIGALALGLAGFGDAMDELGAEPAAFEEIIKRLAPSAQAAAREIYDVTNALQDVALVVQQSLFDGLADNLDDLGAQYLPVVEKGLSGIAGELGDAGEAFMAFATRATTVEDAAVGLENIRKATIPLAQSVVNLSQVFRDTGSVGAALLPDLSLGFANATGRLRDFIAEARATGQLAEWMQDGVDATMQFGRVIGNTGGTLNAVFEAADQGGLGFLDTLERVTGAAERFLESTEGQRAAREFFTSIREVVDELHPGIADLGGMVADFVGELSDTGTLTGAAGAFSALADGARPVAGILGQITGSVLPPLLGGLSAIAPILGPAVAGFLAFRTVSAVMGGLQGRVAGLGQRLGMAGINAGIFAERMGASERTQGRFASASAGVSRGLDRVAGALPVIGALLIAGGLAWDSFRSKAEDAAAAVLSGSMTMRQAVQQESEALANQQQVYAGLDGAIASDIVAKDRATLASENYAEANARVTAEIEKIIAGMGPLEQAQARVTLAQQRLNLANETFGVGSNEAVRATNALAGANRELAIQQIAAAEGVDRSTAAVMYQGEVTMAAVNAGIAYERSLITLEEAQRRAGEAALNHAADSIEVRQANLDLRDAFLRVADAARAKAAADAEVTGSANAAEAGSAAFRQELLRLATTVEGPLRSELIGLADQTNSLPGLFEAAGAGVSGMIRSIMGAVTGMSGLLGVELQLIQAAFDAVPDSKEIRVDALTDPARAKLQELGFFVEEMPDGTFRIVALTDEAKAEFQSLVETVRGTTASMIIDGNIDPVTGKITQSVTLADGSIGVITVDGNAAPADGKIYGAIRLADGSVGIITVDANQTPANGKINATVTYANGSTGTIQVNANAAGANSAINNAARDRTSTIYVRWVSSGTGYGARPAPGYAMGGIHAAQMHDGGVVDMHAGGRLTPMRGGRATVVGPNTWRVIGDRARDDEAYIPINRSARSRSILEATAARMGYAVMPLRGMASGGVVDAARELLSRIGSGGHVFEDFSYRGMSRNLGVHNDRLVDMYVAAGRGSITDFLRRVIDQAAAPAPRMPQAERPAANPPTPVPNGNGWDRGIRADLRDVVRAINDLDVRIAVVERQAQTAREGSGEVQRRLRRQASPHLGGMFG